MGKGKKMRGKKKVPVEDTFYMLYARTVVPAMIAMVKMKRVAYMSFFLALFFRIISSGVKNDNTNPSWFSSWLAW
jgi:hypothetical protein